MGFGVRIALAFLSALAVAPAHAEGLLNKKGQLTCACDAPISTAHLFDDLRAGCPDLKTTSEFMACMPEELRGNYTLVHDSGSPQCASPSSPRIILHSNDGRTMVSFPGDLGEPQGKCSADSVEIVEFDAKTKRFVPKSVTLPGAGGTLKYHQGDAATGQCASCHSKDFHPNWSSYPRWPGVYGANHEKIKPGSKEAADYLAFVERVKKNPLYQGLLPPPSKTAPYDLSKKGDANPREVNAELNNVIARRNTERMARKFSEAPGFSKIKYRLLSGLLAALNPGLKGCQRFDPKELDPIKISVSNDLNQELAIVNGKMDAYKSGYTPFRPGVFPSRADVEAEAAAGPGKPTPLMDLVRSDAGVRNGAMLAIFAAKLGIPDISDFFARLDSDRYQGGKPAYLLDRTVEHDARMGGMLAQALFREMTATEKDDPGAPLKEPFPLTRYLDPDKPGVENDLCYRFDDKDPARSLAQARRVYGDEECRNGIREYPENDGPPSPSICEKLANADRLVNPCAKPATPVLKPEQQGQVDDNLRVLRNVGNPLVNCYHCHDGSFPGAPVIPFDNPEELAKRLKEPGSRLGEDIVEQLRTRKMPLKGPFVPEGPELDRVRNFVKDLKKSK